MGFQMARDSPSREVTEEDEYIDIEISSSTTFFCYSSISPLPHPKREFEFQMFSKSLEKENYNSPADELFYKGKLLPLHLPPRLQMVKKLLQSSSKNNLDFEMKSESFEEKNFKNSLPPTTTIPTPFLSCNISPSESCEVSRELNPDEYFFDCGTETIGFIDENKKKSWYKKLMFTEKSSIISLLKLQNSKTYLKSLFTKSGCLDDQSCEEEALRNGHEKITISKAKECLNKYIKGVKKNPFGQIYQKQNRNDYRTRGTDKEKMIDDNGSFSHRRSFSGAIKKHSATNKFSTSSKSSSSSCSSGSSSNGFYEVNLLKSTNSEIESPIQGAISHCKQSYHKSFRSRKTVSEVGFCSLIAAYDDQENLQLCRGG